ncbi:MAG: Periplasmic aromatic aldehyde oxidoreductase, molybdenum binding subunit YagR [Myxococcales bacterium]|nr:Periplasmic aromatic aldehyde oxidoreductase, molybdenum binding subunit YagR [Myxococcales bacterium]
MIGKPLNRIDGPLKVTGRAVYTSEEWGVGQPLYGVMVEATIGRGRITRLDTSRAEAAPGVRGVITHRNAPRQQPPDPSASTYSRALPVLTGPEIHYFAEPIALVVATTFEQARAAARLVEVAYDVIEGRYDLAARADQTFSPKDIRGWWPTDSIIGDFDAELGKAPHQIDVTYTVPYELSLPMEPHCCLAVWKRDAVTVYTSTQIVSEARARIAATFGLSLDNVRVVARFIGGGFGSKLAVHAETMLAVIAARQLRQPVKVVATRQQVFHLAGHRPASIQRMRLGAAPDGRLIAFGHDTTQKACPTSDYIEQIGVTGRALYAAPFRRTTHRAVELDLPPAEDVRAPGEAPGLLAIECGMDELAYALDMDPVDLRLTNEPATHPESGLPFSDRHLVECLREGAKQFGWDRRPQRPATLREGRWLTGYGMAAAIRPHFQAASSAEVQLHPDGTATVRADMTDIGTGSYTILAQVASEALGIPVERVRVELGDSAFPAGAGSGGSWGATNSCSALSRACDALRDQVLAAVPDADRSAPGGLVELVAKHFPAGASATGSIPDMDKEPSFAAYSLASYGAHFVELQVDADTGEIRLRRMLGVFDAGRIFNAKTARSQLIGGMIWGVSNALFEEGSIDTRTGAFMNRDFAQYLMPVHADIPAIEAVILDGFDTRANVLGGKGIGELGICGSGAAVANAVYNATGIRVRDFPITLEKLLPHLPSQ